MAGVLLAACSAQDATSAESGSDPMPLDVRLDQEVNSLNPAGDMVWMRQFHSFVHIAALEDEVTVLDARVNRGNCSVSWYSHNSPLRFGQEIKGMLSCDQDNVREVTVTTDKGTYTFNF